MARGKCRGVLFRTHEAAIAVSPRYGFCNSSCTTACDGISASRHRYGLPLEDSCIVHFVYPCRRCVWLLPAVFSSCPAVSAAEQNTQQGRNICRKPMTTCGPIHKAHMQNALQCASKRLLWHWSREPAALTVAHKRQTSFLLQTGPMPPVVNALTACWMRNWTATGKQEKCAAGVMRNGAMSITAKDAT